MVNTRSSQHVTHKRRRTSTESLSKASSIRLNKIRKTARRRFTTAEEQLQDEEREASLERSREPSQQPRAWSVATAVESTVPTRSRHDRYSLPVDLPVPDNVKFESLRSAIARRNERCRRHTEGVVAEGVAEFPGEAAIYVDPRDLDIQAGQLVSSTSGFSVRAKHRPITVSPRPSPNVKREDDIREYEQAICVLTEEKASLATKLQILALSIRGLGFGDASKEVADICSTLRIEFDQLRAQEAEMAIDLPIEDLSNQELLQQQPDIIRGLLVDVEELARKLEETETGLVFTNAEYEGVLGKLAEQEDRNEELETQVQEIHQHLDTKNRDLDAERTKTAQLTTDNELLSQQLQARSQEISSLQEASDRQGDKISALDTTCDDLRGDVAKLEEHIRHMIDEQGQRIVDLKADTDERLDFMTEELEQEHYYRQIAEDEITAKDTAYTVLQIQYQQTKSDLEDTEKDMGEARELINEQNDELKTLRAELKVKDADKQQLGQAVSELEEKAEDLEEDIKALAERSSYDQERLKEQDTALKSAGQQIETLDKQQMTADAEINKLRADVDALRKENFRVLAEHAELRKALVMRSKDARILKDINVQLLADAEHDIAASRDLTDRKAQSVAAAKQALDTTQDGTKETAEEEVEAVIVEKTTSVRDSGYHGSNRFEDDILLA